MMNPLRVLIVDDSTTDAKLVIQALRLGGRLVEFERVDTPDGMRAALESRGWDVVISDWSMPKFNVEAALGVLKEKQLDIPFIIVSGTIGEEAAVEAMRTGAHDYVLKDKLARLVPAVERELRECEERKSRRASDARYRRIIEKTNQGVWLIDTEGRTTFANDRMATILGSTASELKGCSPAEFLDDEGRAHLAAHLESHKAGRSAQSEVCFRRKDGTQCWTILESSPLLDDAGHVEGAFAMVKDITERRRAQEALRVSEARFTKLAASGIIGIVVGDGGGNIVEANDAFLRMVGYSRDDLVRGKVRWRELTAPESQSVTNRGIEELAATGVATPYETEYVRKDGSRVPVLLGIATLDESRSIAFMIDLTAQKGAESALQKTEAQLRQAQKMDAVGRLAGGVAHDFNNMLSVVLSYSSLIVAELRPGDPIRDDVMEIEKAGQRAAALTRQLLMFSRQEVEEQRVLDLNEVLANMDKMLERILGEDVDLVSRRAPKLGRIRVDPSHIEQVVMNLVVNARDAMPTGGKLTIETENVVLDEAHAREHLGITPGSYVMLAVSDTGMGMDKATQALMFDPFFTTKEKGKGTGLGLSTVFGIVRQCKGSIWVYSELGKGTTFKVYIPLVDAEVDVVAPSIAPAKLTGSETILLVEDEDQIRTVVHEILRKQGYVVIEARNAGEALLHCENHAGAIDLLLTDVVMPQMSGPELAKRLMRSRPQTRVLCMSGYTDEALERHGAIEAGFAYLQKPITPMSLTQKVRMVLDSR